MPNKIENYEGGKLLLNLLKVIYVNFCVSKLPAWGPQDWFLHNFQKTNKNFSFLANLNLTAGPNLSLYPSKEIHKNTVD